MSDPLPDVTEEFARTLAPTSDEVIEEMDARADREGFPTVGPAVGGWLRLLARSIDAERVFEFGSGYGYSAYWFARALDEDGEIVLTEFDADELDMAREYMERGGFDALASYEHGDAIEIIEGYDGPFDVVLVDVRKDQYPAAFEAVREKVAPGGVIVADNAMTAGTIEFEKLLSIQEGEDVTDLSEATRGIAEYLRATQDAAEFTTAVMPVGEGIAVSYRSA